ncbi:MAG: hypothetical protein KGQ60_00290 [Planctomycetes bacterium]|nr:hypothetical protein [Planctomycetota bacterium]
MEGVEAKVFKLHQSKPIIQPHDRFCISQAEESWERQKKSAVALNIPDSRGSAKQMDVLHIPNNLSVLQYGFFGSQAPFMTILVGKLSKTARYAKNPVRDTRTPTIVLSGSSDSRETILAISHQRCVPSWIQRHGSDLLKDGPFSRKSQVR